MVGVGVGVSGINVSVAVGREVGVAVFSRGGVTTFWGIGVHPEMTRMNKRHRKKQIIELIRTLLLPACKSQ